MSSVETRTALRPCVGSIVILAEKNVNDRSTLLLLSQSDPRRSLSGSRRFERCPLRAIFFLLPAIAVAAAGRALYVLAHAGSWGWRRLAGHTPVRRRFARGTDGVRSRADRCDRRRERRVRAEP